MLTGPVNVVIFAESQQEIELFGEEVVVVFELEAEERERLDEGAASCDDLGAAVGDQVEGCEVLKDADRVGGAEYGDRRGEADVLRTGRCRGRSSGACTSNAQLGMSKKNRWTGEWVS